MTKIIDLSVTLSDNRSWAPRWARTRVKYQDHRFGAWAIRMMFGVPAKLLRTGLGWANEEISLSTHATTHVDAPWHYAPTSEGRPARTIDELPLEWFYGPGVVLDMRHVPSESAASVADLEQALLGIPHDLAAGDIVLIRTDSDKDYESRAYFSRGPGVSAEATRWLIDCGVRLMGIDAWGWDRPLVEQAKAAKRTGDTNTFWAAHFVGVDHEYCQIERLANLDQLPATGFTICAFPLKVQRGSAGPARVVAIVDEV